jgi:hypothetical protein
MDEYHRRKRSGDVLVRFRLMPPLLLLLVTRWPPFRAVMVAASAGDSATRKRRGRGFSSSRITFSFADENHCALPLLLVDNGCISMALLYNIAGGVVASPHRGNRTRWLYAFDCRRRFITTAFVGDAQHRRRTRLPYIT